jgi:hypothetical protein
MNKWAKRTVEIATTSDYLDRLYDIYPSESKTRQVKKEVLTDIRKSYEKRDCKELLRQLLDLETFPFKDSYVSFLRSDREALERNPRTVKRICEAIFTMEFEELQQGIERPKEANTRRGPQFTDWARDSFRHVSIGKFLESEKGIIFLDDSDKKILDFCNTQLQLGLSKRPDFVAKSGQAYVAGEAKFLSSLGGNQGRGFDDAVGLANKPAGKAHKVAIVDGVVWISPGSQEFKKISYSAANIFSVLLLRKFLTDLR